MEEKRKSASFDRQCQEVLLQCRHHAINMWGMTDFTEEILRYDSVDRILHHKQSYRGVQNGTWTYAIVRVVSNGTAYCVGVHVLVSWPKNIYTVTRTSRFTGTELTYTSTTPSDDLGSEVFYERVFWRWVTTGNLEAETILIAWHGLAENRQTLERVARGPIEEPA